MKNMMIGLMNKMKLKKILNKTMFYVVLVAVLTALSMFLTATFNIMPLTFQSALGCMSFWGLVFLSELYDYFEKIRQKIKNVIF